MMRICLRWFVVVSCLMVCGCSGVWTAWADQTAGTPLKFPSSGTELALDGPWAVEPLKGQEGYLITNRSREVQMSLFVIEQTTMESLSTYLTAPGQPIPDHTIFPMGGPNVSGSLLWATYRVEPHSGGEDQVMVIQMRMGPSHDAMVMLGVSPRTEQASLVSVAAQVVHNTRFSVVAPAPAVEAPRKRVRLPPAPTGVWADALRGRRLVRYNSFGGTSQRIVWNLCSNGQFVSGNTTVSQSGLGEGIINLPNGGVWAITGSTMTMHWSDGDVFELALERRGEQTWINGQRWFVSDNPVCS